MSAEKATTNATERARLQDFFARLVAKDFDSLAKELPPSPTKSRLSTSSVTSPRSSMSSDGSSWPKTPETRRRALSIIGNDCAVVVAEDHEFTFEHPTHDFESLEEMKRTAVDEIAASQRKYQPLPVDLRPRKMSMAAFESEPEAQAPQSPKKAHLVPHPDDCNVEGGTYEATGVSDGPFKRVPPRTTRGSQQTPRTRKDSAVDGGEEVAEELRPDSLINETLVLNFVREMHERSRIYSSEELDLTGLRLPTMFPTSRPSFSFGETRQNIATLEDRPMKRFSDHDWTLDL